MPFNYYTKDHDDFRAALQSLSFALNGLQTALAAEQLMRQGQCLEELRRINERLSCVQLNDLRKLKTISHAATSIFEKEMRKTGTLGSEQLKRCLMSAMTSSGAPAIKFSTEELESAVIELQREVKELKKLKEDSEALFLAQIAALLCQETCTAAGPSGSGPSGSGPSGSPPSGSGPRASRTQWHAPELYELFRCPISLCLMRDPVVLAETGNTYDRSSIREHLAINQIDPLTREPINATTLTSNRSLREAIQKWLTYNGIKAEEADQIDWTAPPTALTSVSSFPSMEPSQPSTPVAYHPMISRHYSLPSPQLKSLSLADQNPAKPVVKPGVKTLTSMASVLASGELACAGSPSDTSSVLHLSVGKVDAAAALSRHVTAGSGCAPPAAIRCIAWHSFGGRLASGDASGNLSVWNVDVSVSPGSGSAPQASWEAHIKAINCIDWHPNDTSRIATAGADGYVRVWNVELNTRVLGMRALSTAGPSASSPVLEARWCPNGVWLAVCTQEGQVYLWNTATQAHTLLKQAGGAARRVSWHPRGDLLAVTCEDGELRIIKSTDTLVTILPGRSGRHFVPIVGAAWSPCESKIAYAVEGLVLVYDGACKQCLRKLQRPEDKDFAALSWHPSGSYLATCSEDGAVYVWSINAREQMRLQGSATCAVWRPRVAL